MHNSMQAKILIGAFVLTALVFLPDRNLVSAQSSAQSIEDLKKEIERREQDRRIRSQNPKGIIYMRADIALAKFRAGKLLILDVNPKGVYDQYHVWGAVLATNVHQNDKIRLPQNVEIALYCQ